MSAEGDLFTNSTESVGELYSQIKTYLASLGEIIYEYKKTSIHCKKKVAFLGVHPKKSWIDVNIVLGRALPKPISRKTEQVSANRFHNEVRLSNLDDLEKIKIYIEESYRESRNA